MFWCLQGGEKRQKTLSSAIFVTFFAVFHPLTGTKTLQKHLHVVEEALSFDLVGHI